MVERRVRDSIEDVCNIAHTEEPQLWGGPSPIHGPVDNSLEGLVSLLEHVLVLVVKLTTPPIDPKKPKVIHDLVTVLVLGVVPKKAKGGSPLIYKVLQTVNKLV